MTPTRPSLVLLKTAGATALVLAAVAAVTAAAAQGGPGRAAMAAVVATIVGAGAAAAVLGRILQPLQTLQAGLAQAARDAAAHEALAQAQNSLEANMNMLRASLQALGEPHRRGDRLFFGDTLVNGDFTVVDAVKQAFGGSATVFLDDVRISTNVVGADGGRAVGTRLAPGKVHDRVLGEGRTFRGTVEILGTPHLTIYEPVLSGGATVGVLYVGLRTAEAGAAGAAPLRETFADMRRSLTRFDASARAREEADRRAAVLRQEADDGRRDQEGARQAAAAAQRGVVDAMSDALERLSRSQLDHRVDGVFPAEYAKLQTDFNAALAALADVLSRITDGAGAMGRSVKEIADAVGDLSQRTERQAATLAETAAALDQITTTVERTAQSAAAVRETAATARTEAESSSTVMREAMAAMTDIDRAAHEIGQIIGLIDEIALQTNLLALNAGIEAARAGDAGRGFAVVAAEVRTLAQRTTDAARDIKALISASSRKVSLGKGLVDESGAALDRIRAQVAEMHGVTVEIASGAREQSVALGQVNAAVNQMDHVTRQNAAMAEETTAASEDLAGGAQDLLRLVGGFRLGPRARCGSSDRSSGGSSGGAAAPAADRLRPAA